MEHLTPIPDGQGVQPGQYERPDHHKGGHRRQISTVHVARLSLLAIGWAGVAMAAWTALGQAGVIQ